jgi:hypothetical protein
MQPAATQQDQKESHNIKRGLLKFINVAIMLFQFYAHIISSEALIFHEACRRMRKL